MVVPVVVMDREDPPVSERKAAVMSCISFTPDNNVRNSTSDFTHVKPSRIGFLRCRQQHRVEVLSPQQSDPPQ